MVATTWRRQVVKQDDSQAAEAAASEVVRDQIEELARTGARDMLMAVMNEEVDAYLRRARYQGDGRIPRLSQWHDAPLAHPRQPSGRGFFRPVFRVPWTLQPDVDLARACDMIAALAGQGCARPATTHEAIHDPLTQRWVRDPAPLRAEAVWIPPLARSGWLT